MNEENEVFTPKDGSMSEGFLAERTEWCHYLGDATEDAQKLEEWRRENNYTLEMMEDVIKNLPSNSFDEADWFYDLSVKEWSIRSIMGVIDIVKECKDDREKMESKLSEYLFAKEYDVGTLGFAWMELYNKYGDGASAMVKWEMTQKANGK